MAQQINELHATIKRQEAENQQNAAKQLGKFEATVKENKLALDAVTNLVNELRGQLENNQQLVKKLEERVNRQTQIMDEQASNARRMSEQLSNCVMATETKHIAATS
uniref:Uncharacterized protein n=1 Tax=Strigamia maritima TaxID=126957 RepID=T1JGZ1_STRMM